ncbi:MAG: hypothetical protein HYX76_01240 [Acidobacteria bacterium]|nr:hypothetical protein [Acidobacteriota bacterium]
MTISRPVAWVLITTLWLPAPASAADREHRDDQTDLARAELMKRYVEKLPIGATVRIRETSGRKERAILLAIEPAGVIVKPKTRVPKPERYIRFDELESVELQPANGTNVGKAIAIGVASGVGTFFGIMLLLLAITDD